MSDYACKRCRDARWICEEHPDSPYPHGVCDAPGVPCPQCQPAEGKPFLPPDWISKASVDDDVNSPVTSPEKIVEEKQPGQRRS